MLWRSARLACGIEPYIAQQAEQDGMGPDLCGEAEFGSWFTISSQRGLTLGTSGCGLA